MQEEKTQTNFLGYLARLMDRFTGDKVIFLIALFLMLISVVSVFSSTPRLVDETHGIDRVSIMVSQLKVVAAGFGIILALYFFGRQSWFRSLSKWGFAVSFALLVILVLSASMSTLSSLVLASSSTLTIDFLKDNLIKDMDEKRQVRIMRMLIVVFIAISVVLALVQYRSNVTFIAQLMGVSWGALAGAFLAPFLYGLYWKRTTKLSCWVSILFSSIFMTIDMLSNLGVMKVNLGLLQSPINAGAFCMLAGLVLVPVVSILTKAPAKAKVDSIFSCYDKFVTVRQTEALADEK